MSRGHYRLFALVVTPAAAGGHPRREAEASSNLDSAYYPPFIDRRGGGAASRSPLCPVGQSYPLHRYHAPGAADPNHTHCVD